MSAVYNFTKPDFCGKEITQEAFVAGGILAGKSYANIEEELTKHGYNRLSLEE